MEDETYKYPYGDCQIHDALEDLDRRLRALEPKREARATEANALGLVPLKGESANALSEKSEA